MSRFKQFKLCRNRIHLTWERIILFLFQIHMIKLKKILKSGQLVIVEDGTGMKIPPKILRTLRYIIFWLIIHETVVTNIKERRANVGNNVGNRL